MVSVFHILPPFVCPNSRGSSKPGVQDKDAPEGLTFPDRSEERGIVTESETLPKPVDAMLPPRHLPSIITLHT